MRREAEVNAHTIPARQRIMDRARWCPDQTVKVRSYAERRAAKQLEARGLLRRTSVRDVWRLA